MSNVPDAWDQDWTPNKADTPPFDTSTPATSKKQTKAQKRAQQAEFNRQLWAEAEGPKETNYFVESRNIVPLRSEFKPPPVLLSRKGPPIVQQKPKTNLGDGLQNLDLNRKEESSEDEDEVEKQRFEREQRQEQAKRDREQKQRKYDERRQELFGGVGANVNGRPTSRSGQSSPNSATPPGSRSQTPNRGRGRGGRGGRGNGQGRGVGQQHQHQHQHQHRQSQQELFDPVYAPKPDSVYIQRRQKDELAEKREDSLEKPIRQSKGPDGSGRGGFGFVMRGVKQQAPIITPEAI